ncbi:MAG TPA: hypothetical protein DHV36_11880 [Desulfobacteraceae bacterium]|nr:hypothetical protein [Desulfobacteraceae bacterium]
MKFILSPTKTMEIPLPGAGSDAVNEIALSAPAFEPEANRLMGDLSALDLAAVGKLFKTGEALTRKTREQILKFSSADTGPSLFAFRGEAFKSLSPEGFDSGHLALAQSRMRIMSGLYGVLRPLDRIKPYRLDVSNALKVDGQTLKAFWRSRLLPYFENFLDPEEPLINLASGEYSSVLAAGPLKSRLVTVQYREKTRDKLKNVAVRAKQARGAFAREIIRQGISSPGDLKTASIDGYVYSGDLSSEREWFFVRPKAA